MPSTIKYFFVYIFIFQLIHAEELFVDTSKLSLAHITLSHKYCKQTSAEHTLCKSKALSYIDYNDPDLPTFLKGIKEVLNPTIENYQKNDLKASTLADIKDFNADISGEWEERSVIELFAQTPTTYTLSSSSGGYSGGAHGYYNVAYKNYSIATQKVLNLDDIFINDYNKTLINIAQRHYKRIYNLQPKEPLTNDDWFDDKFVLAENIAITSQGLYFHYNSYEIKPYAAGQTAFLLPTLNSTVS